MQPESERYGHEATALGGGKTAIGVHVVVKGIDRLHRLRYAKSERRRSVLRAAFCALFVVLWFLVLRLGILFVLKGSNAHSGMSLLRVCMEL